MTQEQKTLILKDLSSRLFYKVKMGHIADTEGDSDTLTGIYEDSITLWTPGNTICRCYDCMSVYKGVMDYSCLTPGIVLADREQVNLIFGKNSCT